MPLLALKIQYGIHDMLEEPGSGNRTFLRHMADDKYGNSAPLREPHQLTGHFLHLADASGRRRELVRVDGLDRVDRDRGWLQRLDSFEDLFQGGFGQDIEERAVDPQTFPSHLDLPGRLLPRHIEDSLTVRGQPGQRLEQEGGLPDAGIAADQHHRTRDHPPAQNPIELAAPGLKPVLPHHLDGVDRGGLGTHSRESGRTALPGHRKTLFLHAVPASAIRAAPQPSSGLMPACLAEETGFGPHRPEPLGHIASGWVPGSHLKGTGLKIQRVRPYL